MTTNHQLAVDIKSAFFDGNVSGTTFSSAAGVANLVTLFLRTALVLSGLILLFYFVMGGIGMISSAGKDDPKAAEQAKSMITTAVTGFVVVFLSYWIVKLVGVILKIPTII
jgi:predicted secreted protein